MQRLQKALALILGSLMAASVFAACGEQKTPSGDNTQTDPSKGETPGQETPAEPTGPDDAVNTRLCYDNLPDDGVAIPASATKVVVKGASGITASGSKKAEDIVTYDEATGIFTAVGEGTVTYTMASGHKGRIEVVPAYATDPGYQYAGDMTDLSEKDSKLLGGTHDPSFIEVRRTEGGASTWYLFSTGWNNTSAVGKNLSTYGNAIHSSRDLITWKFEGRTFNEANRREEFVDNTAGRWMYGLDEQGTTAGYSSDDASWWAPDIVECPSGGYWLYTCVVDGAGDTQGVSVPGYTGNYARACILLYHSDSLDAGSFTPVTFPEGHPDAGKQVVLMQSSIRRGESEKDVNGIDPQIIYSPDGKMYMAYGSFGSGNYMIELDPETGMRKDGKGWQTQETLRHYIDFNTSSTPADDNIQDLFNHYENADAEGKDKAIGWEHEYYGKNISKANMEAPVFARHDDVKVADETAEYDENGEPKNVTGKTYYYTMHSYDGLGDNYQMWGGRSENVWGLYKSVNGGIVFNDGIGYKTNQGNKYMGAFRWDSKSAGVTEYDVMLTGHNDLYTTKDGTSLAAYITRIPDASSATATNNFAVQLHQYYLNSLGHIVINPNRYGGEIDRAVSKEELFKYTEKDASNAYKFKMVVMANHRDTQSGDFRNISNVSVDVTLMEDGKIKNAAGAEIGTWLMYGKGYIKIEFATAPQTTPSGTDARVSSGNTVYYGVVRPAWLGDQNKSGFTITALGSNEGNAMSMPLFFNNYSTITGKKLVG